MLLLNCIYYSPVYITPIYHTQRLSARVPSTGPPSGLLPGPLPGPEDIRRDIRAGATGTQVYMLCVYMIWVA